MSIFPKAVQCWVASHIWPWRLLVLLAIVGYTWHGWRSGDHSWFSRGGGVVSLIGLLMTTIASIRVDEAITRSKLTEDQFFCEGFVISALGILAWALA